MWLLLLAFLIMLACCCLLSLACRGSHMLSSSANNFSTFSDLRFETANEFAVASGAGVRNTFTGLNIAPRTTPYVGTGELSAAGLWVQASCWSCAS